MTDPAPHEQHRFRDTMYARRALTQYRDFLVGLPADDFAQAVLDVIKPFEREKPIRILLRQRFPHGSQGFVPEDLDLVLRHFGARYGTDAKGRLRLVETKFNPTTDKAIALKAAQANTFKLLDELLAGSSLAERYDGFYVVTHTHFEPLEGRIWIGRIGSGRPAKEVTADQFVLWLSGEVPADRIPKATAA